MKTTPARGHMRLFTPILLTIAFLSGCSDEESGDTAVETTIPDDTDGAVDERPRDNDDGDGRRDDEGSGTGGDTDGGDTDTDSGTGGNNGSSDLLRWYTDCDIDGYGDIGVYVNSAAEPLYAACGDNDPITVSWTLIGGDCKDDNAAIAPGMPDTSVDGVDQDCNGVDGTSTSMSTWYADADGDTYGNASSPTTAVTQPVGYVANATDCLDSNSAVNPAGSEGTTVDGLDNDCDGTIDEGTSSGGGGTSTGVQICVTTASTVAVCEVMVHNDTNGDLTYWGGLADWSTAGNTESQSDYASTSPDDLAELFTVTGASTTACATYPNASVGNAIEINAYCRLTNGSYNWGVNRSWSTQYLTSATANGNSCTTLSGDDYGCTVSE